LSVNATNSSSRLFQTPSFVPLAFLFWNTGDLLGRLLPAVPRLSLIHRPKLIFVLAIARVGFIPLYHLCNIRGQGAVVNSDLFYLVVVQLLFGISNGYLGSMCMMGAAEWVEPEEREASGGFMGLCLVAGLAFGSLISFFAAKA
jgi:equilibrative nucleoside transporter 1/2/3